MTDTVANHFAETLAAVGVKEPSRLGAIVASSNQAIVSKTLDGIVTLWNAAASDIFGYGEAEMTGQPITRIIPPELHDEEYRILLRLRKGELLRHHETIRVSKDGRRLDVSLIVSPLVDNLGRVVGAAKIASNITQSKLAERAFREAAAHLCTADCHCRRHFDRSGYADNYQARQIGSNHIDGTPARAIFFGSFCLLPAQQLLFHEDVPVSLGSRAMDLLTTLIERAGELVTKKELMARAWPNTFVEPANLTVQLSAVRRALGDGRDGNRFVITVPGRGYRFVAPVTFGHNMLGSGLHLKQFEHPTGMFRGFA